MTGEAYLEALSKFTTEHSIPRDIASRIRKASEELGELSEAAVNREWQEIKTEACDLVNVAFDLLRCVSNDPWAALMENLAEKDAKYKVGQQRTEEKK